MEDEIVQEIPDTVPEIDLSSLEDRADDLKFAVGELQNDVSTLGDAVNSLVSSGNGDDEVIGQLVQLVAFCDLLLVLVLVALFLVGGLLLGQTIVRRL